AAPIFDHGTITNVGVDSVTLRRGDGATTALSRDGQMGMRWLSGYGSVGAILVETNESITRTFTPAVGVPAEGDGVIVDGLVYYGDPFTDHAIEYETVSIRGPLGDYDAWLVGGTRMTWTIYVHGRGTDRTESLRLLPTTVESGFPALVIRYENDPESPGNGTYHYGLNEYRDVEVAIRFALDGGAQDVVLVGYSMGGSVISEFMHRSPFADRVSGLVLDAPMLDLGRVVDLRAEDRGVPTPLVAVAKTAVAMRFGVNWSELDYVTKLARADVPTLVFHGTEDDMVPIDLSRALDAAAPRFVQLHEIQGAGHVQSWNVDPTTYQTLVRVFLEALTQDVS
ncbi:MAG: lysophospholipase, partial [Acidimicrobiia bacterium]|nr:lysophospholipase [Acidimicrobiia bacterium]